MPEIWCSFLHKLPKFDGFQVWKILNIQYSHPKLSVMLTLMFNSMIQHGYVPEAFMDTLILPIVKDTKEDLGDSDNYRPIALTSVISKVFELVILERCRSTLDTSPH